MVGISALVVGIVCSPFAQGALRFLPQAVEDRQENQFRWALWKIVVRHVVIAQVAILLGGAGWVFFYGGPAISVLILVGMLIADSARTIEMAFYNGSRRQRLYAGWAVAEAWGRPLLAVAFVLAFGSHAWAVLFGYFSASIINFFLFGFVSLVRTMRRRHMEITLSPEILSSVRKYCRPLMPIGLVGWVNALSDRYLIAAILGMHQAGMYAAIYGLISRPFMIIQGTLELTLRPVYFQSVAKCDSRSESEYYKSWLTLNALAGLILLLFLISCGENIVYYLLADTYHKSAKLIPFLAIGNFLLIVAYSLNGYFYAHEHTKILFIVSVATAFLSLITVAAFSIFWGITGAAGACIVYFGFQACVLASLLWKYKKINL
jgi:O-antigen/teichoic acid export membrane protein